MSEIIISKVMNYLSELQRGVGTKIDFATMGSFASSITSALRRQLSPDDMERTFHLMMSNIGRPGCTLQAEKFGMEKEPAVYSDKFRNIYGDMIESAAVAIMRLAGVNVLADSEKVSLEIAGKQVNGKFDVVIGEPEPKVYDIKSASGFLFRHKYSEANLATMWDEGDTFGYVTQIYLYSAALKLPVGGLIIINKENGEWGLVPPPQDEDKLRQAAFKRAEENVRLIHSAAPFRRDYTDMAEIFKRKPTGNRVLIQQCSFCNRKTDCWPGVQKLPQVVSKGENPKYLYYTHLKDEFKNG